MSPTLRRYRQDVLHRFASITVIVAIMAAVAVLGMHVVDAHPKAAAHEHTTIYMSAASPPHSRAADHEHAAQRHTSSTQTVRATSAGLLHTQANTVNTAGERGHTGHGHSGGFAHHIAMCAAVVSSGLAGAYYFGLRGRVSPTVVKRLIGMPKRIDPPVPRRVLAAI